MDAVDDEATVASPQAVPTGIGSLLAGRYRLTVLLGRGGMASVYRADDESLGRPVAIKIFHTGLAHAQDSQRQREETSLLASLNHPGLVTLFDAVSDDEDSFLVMEFVDGESLGSLVAREGAIPLARVVEIASGICAHISSSVKSTAGAISTRPAG